MDGVRLSQQYLSAVRDREDTTEYREQLQELDLGSLSSDAAKKAFWINVYNAAAQELVEDHWLLFRTRLLYMLPLIHVTDHRISLNTIYDGFLRRSRLSIGRGYLPRPMTTSLERRMRVDERDPRVHFALNTGILGRPRIRFYSASHIDHELDMATKAYLDDRVVHNPKAGTVRVPTLFRSYSADFGGRSGIVSFLKDHGQLPDHARPSLQYERLDREKATRRFT